MDFQFHNDKLDKDIKFTELKITGNSRQFKFKKVCLDNVMVNENGILSFDIYPNIKTANGVVNIHAIILDSSSMKSVLGKYYSSNLKLRITSEDYKILDTQYKKERAEEEHVEFLKREEYDKILIKDDTEIIIHYSASHGFSIMNDSKSNILEENQTLLNRVNKFQNIRNSYARKFSLYDWGEYTSTDRYKVSFSLFQIEVASLKEQLEEEIKCQMTMQKRKDQERLDRIEVLKAKAKKEGKPQEWARWNSDCNDPNEACDLDNVTEFITEDGKFFTKRQHTW